MPDAGPSITMTAEEMHSAISAIIDKRSTAASQSPYDRMVCVGAVSEARRVFDGIPVQGTADEYGDAVLSAIGKAQQDYYDPDGEYTSGKSSIGDIYLDISFLLKGRSINLKASCT